MKSMSLLIAAFAALLIGIMLINSVASETYSKTGRGVMSTEEQLNIASAINGDSAYVNSSIVFTLGHTGIQCSNGDGGVLSGSMRITNTSATATGRRILTSGNYTVDYAKGTIVFLNTSTLDVQALATGGGWLNGSNITLLNYSYYPNDYLCQGWNRTVLNLIPGFFGIAILLIGLGLFYQVAKEEGIFDKI